MMTRSLLGREDNRRRSSMRKYRNRLVAVGIAIVTVVAATVALVPTVTAQAVEAPLAVDVDLIDGGVWVTYSNGCVESRAWWRQQIGPEGKLHRGYLLFRCAAGDPLISSDHAFYSPRVIRAPLTLRTGEHVVALVPTGADRGYWMITSDGRVVTGGSAAHLGDLSAFNLNAPVVAAAPTNSGNGYYMLSADGGVFAFGDAQFYGSVQGLVDAHIGLGTLAEDHISAPVFTLATTPAGYWLVGVDGTVYPFGDAPYHGSLQDALNLNNQLADVTRDWLLTPEVASGAPRALDALVAPVVDVVPSADGSGYQMVAADGGIFTFGTAAFHGSLAGRTTSRAVASDVTTSRSGYVILTENGTVHPFGTVSETLDSVGRTPTELTPNALPASECRPEGRQGFGPFRGGLTPTGTFRVGVLFIEFDDYRANRKLYPIEIKPNSEAQTGLALAPNASGNLPFVELRQQVELAANYIEAMSYGKLNVEVETANDWVSIGPLRDEYWSKSAANNAILAGSALKDAVFQHTAEAFDYSNKGLGFDALLIYFPTNWFRGGYASYGIYMTERVTSGPIATVGGGTLRSEPSTVAYSSWWTAAHELLHLLGLDDLYAYASSYYPERSARAKDGSWSGFGIMGFSDYYPQGGRVSLRSGEVTLFDGSSFEVDSYISSSGRANELLAWHRWLLNWLEARQIVCLELGDGTVDLSGLADPKEGVAMASIRLSNGKFLVLENRIRFAYDADYPSGEKGPSQYFVRLLNTEGVLAYIVDIDGRGGQVPVRMFAPNTLKPGEDWTIGPGESRSGTLPDGATLRLDVSEGPNGTARVQVTTS